MEHAPDNLAVDLNVQRCIDLHNRIVSAAVDSPNGIVIREAVTNNYFDYWDHADEPTQDLLEVLTDPVKAFLQGCHVLDFHQQCFTIRVRGLAPPSQMHPIEGLEDYTNYILLYGCPDPENDRLGLVFDMDTNKASWIDDMFNLPPDNTESVWTSLESVLEAWIREIDRQRELPGGMEQAYPGEPEGWHFSYPPPKDTEDALSAWSQYVQLVEDKAAASVELPPKREPLGDTGLRGMAAAFLNDARRPRFQYVAPELVFPSASQVEAMAVRQHQRFLAADGSIEDDEVVGWKNVVASVIFPLGDNINAGLCTCNDRGWQDTAGLILPTSNSYEAWSGEINDQNINPPDFERVWQTNNGVSPFWAPHYARLASIFKLWAQFVEDGTWPVGESGVIGSLRDHATEEEYTDITGETATRLSGMLFDDFDA